MKNARFWICAPESYVKVTLRPGQSISFSHGGPHEEGYSYTHESYTYDEERGGIVREHDTNARDCDGRIDRSSADFCFLHLLTAGQEGYQDSAVRLPRWEDMRASQRDYSAEAAGY
jgi:hypothetical protein